MTELKTLKGLDLKERDFIGENATMKMFHGLVTIEELKQEAIKWISSSKAQLSARAFIIEFFNLTEEDLK